MKIEDQNLVYRSRPVSRRNRMDISHRAKQFAPFAALRGFDTALKERTETHVQAMERNVSESERHCKISPVP